MPHERRLIYLKTVCVSQRSALLLRVWFCRYRIAVRLRCWEKSNRYFWFSRQRRNCRIALTLLTSFVFTHTYIQTHTHTHTHTLTNTLTHTLTQTRSRTLALNTHAHDHTHPHSLTHTYTQKHTHSITHTHTHTQTHTLSLSHTNSHTHALTHTQTLSHTLTHTNSLSHTHTHPLTHTHCKNIYLHSVPFFPSLRMAVLRTESQHPTGHPVIVAVATRRVTETQCRIPQ